MAVRAGSRKNVEPPVASLSWAQVMSWRLRHQRLDRRAPRAAMFDVISGISGLHAQVLSSAVLTLWARVDDLEPGVVERALWEERSLVKTWAMRGTLHLLPAAEFPMWAAALSPFWQHYLRPSWLRYFGVTPEELEQLVDAIAEALDGHMLTRKELGEEVSRLTGSPALGEHLSHSWGSMLKPAAFRGQLCFAPSVGRNVRFTRPAWWLNDWREVDVDEAKDEVTRRFLAACGPATRDDFARWWGVAAAPAGAMIKHLGAEVAPVEVEGAPAWMLAEHVAEAVAASPPGSVRLLPAFDQYVVAASRHASYLLPGDLKDRVYRPQGWLSPVLLIDGRMDGVWRHERKGRRLVVGIEPLVPLPAWAKGAAEEEAERLAGFLGGRLELNWRMQT